MALVAEDDAVVRPGHFHLVRLVIEGVYVVGAEVAALAAAGATMGVDAWCPGNELSRHAHIQAGRHLRRPFRRGMAGA